MLFLLKRRWPTSLTALVFLTGSGWVLRLLWANEPPVAISWETTGIGFGVFGGILASDAIVYALLSQAFGQSFRKRFEEFASLFKEQTLPAIITAALLAGLGEELFFRGIGADPVFLGAMTVLFGLLHHVRRSLWPFTVWSTYEGFLLAAAVYLTGSLWVTMVAHFLHDLAGFLVFRLWRPSP
jgi:membrane protease YdiL (CAAX protease family)